MNLRLPLKRKWFEMTKAGIKTEDYRELKPYWLMRLFNYHDPEMWDESYGDDTISELKLHDPEIVLSSEGHTRRIYEYNIITLGYPKKTDTDKILKLEHKGVEIRTGNPEWGAEPGKLYFVIKHGRIL